MKTLAIILSLALAGCSFKVVRQEPSIHSETEYHLNKQKVAFIEFHQFFIQNQNMPNSEVLKNRATEMMFKAGLYHACHNKSGCYLVYGEKKIRFERETISIEYDNTYISVENANIAARIIYE